MVHASWMDSKNEYGTRLIGYIKTYVYLHSFCTAC
jgi:hypothetical protein